MTVAANAYTYVLWRHTGGDVALWKLDPSLDIAQYGGVIGSIPGWIAEGLAVDTDGSSYLRLIWRNTNGAVAVWCVDQYLNICGKSPALGPYVGVAPER